MPAPPKTEKFIADNLSGVQVPAAIARTQGIQPCAFTKVIQSPIGSLTGSKKLVFTVEGREGQENQLVLVFVPGRSFGDVHRMTFHQPPRYLYGSGNSTAGHKLHFVVGSRYFLLSLDWNLHLYWDRRDVEDALVAGA